MRITLIITTLISTLLGVSPAQAAPLVPAGSGCGPADIVASAPTPDGGGYWLASADGAVYPYGTAPFYGSALGTRLTARVVDLVPTAMGGGYWLVTADGAVLAYGDAAPLRSPQGTGGRVVAAARQGMRGLILAGSDGSVYALGTARFRGGASGASIASVVTTPGGYWLVAGDGTVFAFGAAPPVAKATLSAPVVDAARQGNDLFIATADGAVTTPGATQKTGAAASTISVTRDGYWLAGRDGSVYAYGVGFLGDALSRPSPCQYALEPVEGTRIAQVATDILNGQAEPGWVGGPVPYSWGGGHKRVPGPSLGTCSGYTGAIRPCPAATTVGLDCSGFARWVYSVAFGRDVFGGVATTGQLARMRKVVEPEPGDLVFFGSSAQRTTHVGVVVAPGQMVEEPRTGAVVRLSSIKTRKNLVGYYHLDR